LLPAPLRQNIAWIIVASDVAAPPAFLVGFIPRAYVNEFPNLSWLLRHPGVLATVVGAAAGLAALGFWRGWNHRARFIRNWGIAAAVVVAVLGSLFFFIVKEQHRMLDKVALSVLRQTEAAAEQFFLENPDRIFVGFDELVGPNRYIHGVTSHEGEDQHVFFPIRRDLTDMENFFLILPDGRRLAYPRVTPPKADGVDVVQLPGNAGRFETTYRNGVPDGPFRAYYPDGKLWGEATYSQGRLLGPPWLYSRTGRKYDELAEGEAAEADMAASNTAAAAEPARTARQELAAGDWTGAIRDFTRALALNPSDQNLNFERGEAKMKTGDLDGAIVDFDAAAYSDEANSHGRAELLEELHLERGRLRRAKNDAAGAAEDFQFLAQAAGGRAEGLIHAHAYAKVDDVLSSALELAPTAELFELRANARRMAGRLKDAEADYTRALEFAGKGVMQIPFNQNILAAQWLYKRGYVRRWLGDLPGAEADFRAAVFGLGDAAMIQRCDAAFPLFAVQCEQGRKDSAASELAELVRSGLRGDDLLIARFLLGEMTEAQFDVAARKFAWDYAVFRAAFYSGMRSELAGDREGALDRLRAACATKTGDRYEIEHEEARLLFVPGAVTLGRTKLGAKDYAGAIVQFTNALQVDPSPWDVYRDRAVASEALHRNAEAIADYQQALLKAPTDAAKALRHALEELKAGPNTPSPVPFALPREAPGSSVSPRTVQGQPELTPPKPLPDLTGPGMEKFKAHDYPGAIAEFTAALGAQPDDPRLYYRRAEARRAKGDHAGAIADLTVVLDKNPLNSGIPTTQCRFERGHLRRLLHDLPGAAEDFRMVASGSLANRDLVSLAGYWLFFTECEQGHEKVAAEDLVQIFARMDHDHLVNQFLAKRYEWKRQLADLLLGRIPESTLIARLDDAPPGYKESHRFEGLFVTAMARRQKGDNAGAVDFFRQALALPVSRSYEFESAEATREVGMLAAEAH
jgi:tetratricopeptide (TPR) repeat protein